MRASSARIPLSVALAGVSLVLLLAGVVGCAAHDPARHDTGRSPARTVHSDPVTPPAELDRLARDAPCAQVQEGQHPAGRSEIARFDARAVVNCRTSERTYPGAGQWQVLTRQVAVHGLARLLDALTRPDVVTPGGEMCAAIGYGPLTILLAGPAGQYLHPRAPATTCGAPQPATLRAIAALAWRTVSVTKLRLITSPAALASGCEMQWKNEIAMEGGSVSRLASGAVNLGAPTDPLVACIYGSAHPASDPGTFQRAVQVDGPRAKELRAALSLPGKAGSCPSQTTFAVLRLQGGPWVNVELGGCWRVMRNDENPVALGRAQPATVRRLLGVT